MPLVGPHKVWIGNLPAKVTATELHWVLATSNVICFNAILDMHVYNRSSDSACRFSVPDQASFDKALELNGTYIWPQAARGRDPTDGQVWCGRPLDVRRAREPTKDRKVIFIKISMHDLQVSNSTCHQCSTSTSVPDNHMSYMHAPVLRSYKYSQRTACKQVCHP